MGRQKEADLLPRLSRHSVELAKLGGGGEGGDELLEDDVCPRLTPRRLIAGQDTQWAHTKEPVQRTRPCWQPH